VANAKRIAAPVKTAAPPTAGKVVGKTHRASIAFGEREHAAVEFAQPRAQRLRMHPITQSAPLSRG
jgi:hypothetical protein